MDRWLWFYGLVSIIGHIEPGRQWKEIIHGDEISLWIQFQTQSRVFTSGLCWLPYKISRQEMIAQEIFKLWYEIYIVTNDEISQTWLTFLSDWNVCIKIYIYQWLPLVEQSSVFYSIMWLISILSSSWQMCACVARVN